MNSNPDIIPSSIQAEYKKYLETLKYHPHENADEIPENPPSNK